MCYALLMRTLAAIAILAGIVQDQTETEQTMQVRRISGELRLLRPGASKPAPLKDVEKCTPLDRLGTAGGMVARFCVDDRVFVMLRGVTASRDKGIGLEKKDQKLVMKLYHGTMVVESYEAQFQVETPHGTLEGREAYVIIEASEKSTRVVSLEGRLTFTNSLGTVTLEPNQGAVAEAGKAPSEPREADAAREAGWTTAEQPKNLIANGGYEEGLANWNAPSAGDAKAEPDEKVFFSGKRSARARISKVRIKGFARSISPSAEVTLQPGKRYLLRAYVRTQAYTVNGKPGTLGVLIVGRDGSRKTSASDQHDCEGRWRCARVLFTASAEKHSVFLQQDEDGVFDGTVWIDDWYLTELPAAK